MQYIEKHSGYKRDELGLMVCRRATKVNEWSVYVGINKLEFGTPVLALTVSDNGEISKYRMRPGR